MARTEPTLAWILPPATLTAERSRPIPAGDRGVAHGWGLGFSTLVHASIVAVIALFWAAPRLDTPPPALEVEIVAAEALPPLASAGAPAVPRSGEPVPEPAPEPAPEPPPIDSASIAPPPVPPPPPPEEEPAPPPPEPTPTEAAKPAEPKPTQPPRPRAPPAPQPQIASKSAAPIETPTEAPVPPGEAVPKTRETAVFRTVPGVTASGRNAQLKPLVSPPPAYPRIALQLREEGTVVLSLEIDTDGRPADVTVLRSSGYGSLDQAAVQAARAWRFQAPMQDGRAVAATVEVPFVFKFKRN